MSIQIFIRLTISRNYTFKHQAHLCHIRSTLKSKRTCGNGCVLYSLTRDRIVLERKWSLTLASVAQLIHAVCHLLHVFLQSVWRTRLSKVPLITSDRPRFWSTRTVSILKTACLLCEPLENVKKLWMLEVKQSRHIYGMRLASALVGNVTCRCVGDATRNKRVKCVGVRPLLHETMYEC